MIYLFTIVKLQVSCVESDIIQTQCSNDTAAPQCGYSFEKLPTETPNAGMQAKIINGRPSVNMANPWMVGITLVDSKLEEIFCGGTLITNRHVLTAAHCVTPFRKSVSTQVKL